MTTTIETVLIRLGYVFLAIGGIVAAAALLIWWNERQRRFRRLCRRLKKGV